MTHPVTSQVLALGPHAGAHRVATRAAVSASIPLVVLLALGHPEWSPFAAFAAFTALYGRRSDRAERAGMQVAAGTAFVVCVLLGVVVAQLPHHDWWAVGAGALVAAGGSLLSDAWGWHPPGPTFPLFAFAACALMPSASVSTALLVAVPSALFAVFVGWVGALRQRELYTVPRLGPPDLRKVLGDPVARRHLLRYLVGTAVAGAVGHLLGGSHPYWAMVAVTAVLAVAGRSHQLARGIQRTLGTLAGVLLAGLLLGWGPPAWVMVAYVFAVQFGAELVVGRNYGLAMVFVTPLALVLGQLAHPQPVGPTLVDRALETAIGALVALAALHLVPEPRPRVRVTSV